MIYSIQGEYDMLNTLLKWLGFKNPMPIESEPVTQSTPATPAVAQVQSASNEAPKVEAEKPIKARKKRAKKIKS